MKAKATAFLLADLGVTRSCQRRRNIGAPGGVKLRQPVAAA
jgi:DNA-directed RNA polymerase subunit N (RpoN/RPB10)